MLSRRSWESWLLARWFPKPAIAHRPSSLAVFFFTLIAWPLHVLFALLAQSRRWAYRQKWLASQRLPVPVIVVGNVTVGGAGKTPLTLYLVKMLQDAGWRPGIISRGYGRQEPAQGASDVMAVCSESDPHRVGDEPVLLARRSGVPVWVGRARAEAGVALLKAQPSVNVLICDDGLQHLALARDVEFVVFDERGAGNGCCLPMGPLREPLGVLHQVGAVIWNGVAPDLGMEAARAVPNRMMRLLPGDFYRLSNPTQRCSAAELLALGGVVHAAAGMGYPDRFFQTLRELGLTVRGHPFPDHHVFVPSDFDFVGQDILLLTEKDAVKCHAFAPANTWVLPVEASLDSSLLDIVLEKIDGYPFA